MQTAPDGTVTRTVLGGREDDDDDDDDFHDMLGLNLGLNMGYYDHDGFLPYHFDEDGDPYYTDSDGE